MSMQRSSQDIASARSLARHARRHGFSILRPGAYAIVEPERLDLRTALSDAHLHGHLTRDEVVAIATDRGLLPS